MIRYLAKYFSTISPVFIDGLLYVMLAITAVNATALTSEAAKELMGKAVLFYGLWFNSAADAALLALKMYRSTSFAEHKEEKKRAGNTEFFVKPTEEKKGTE